MEGLIDGAGVDAEDKGVIELGAGDGVLNFVADLEAGMSAGEDVGKRTWARCYLTQ